MIFRRQRIAPIVAVVSVFFAATSLLPRASAQETGGTSTPTGGTSGSGQSSGSPTTPSTPNTPATPGAPGASTPGTAASPESGGGGGPAAPTTPPPSLSVGGGYGFSQQTLTMGEGALAKPKLRFSVSVSQGFDDNIYSSSGKKQKVTVNEAVVLPGVQQPPVLVITGSGISLVSPPVVPRIVIQPVVREVPTQPIKSSATSTVGLGADIQFATPRTALTFSVNGNLIYYYNRPDTPYEESGSLNLLFIHRISPRMQFNAQVTASLSSQPDYGNVNGPTQANTGSHILASGRFDLTYQLTARIHVGVTYSAQILSQSSETAQDNGFFEQTFGEEIRYMASPRAYFVTQLRETITSHNDPTRDSSSNSLLVGLDYTFSPRLNTTFRVGEQVRTYAAASGSAPTPYFEHSLSYKYGGGMSTVSWNSRYGFEEAQSSNVKQITLRTGLGVNHAFGSRLQGTLGINYVRNNNVTFNNTVTQTDQSLDASLGFNYLFSPKLTFNGSIAHTESISTNEFAGYRRNRASIGASYTY